MRRLAFASAASASAVVSVLVLGASSAHALEQKKHRAISEGACLNVGLPDDFCERVGVEAYDVDSYEWNDLSAHAQIDVAAGQSRCSAANKALDRVRTLGSDIRASLGYLAYTSSEEDATHVAVQLGRALHTIQDDCAHHGMTNPQHAWYSLSDTCEGTKDSPDLDPAAFTCAERETAAVMDAFATAVADAGVANWQLDGIDGGWTHWPARGGVCEFLKSAKSWDGVDTRWDNGLVVPYLQDQLDYAMTMGDESLGDVCTGDLDAITPAWLWADADLSDPPSWCWKVRAYCVGKADAPDEAPPWSDDATAPTDPTTHAGGCSIGGADPREGGIDGVIAVLLFAATAILVVRFRSRGVRGRRAARR